MRTSFDVHMDEPRSALRRPDLTPVTIVSADSHACLPPTEYEAYLDPQYRGSFGLYLDDIQVHHQIANAVGYPFTGETLDVIDTRGAIEAAGEIGYFDPVWRLRQAEAEGVVAEFLHPFGTVGFTPFFDGMSSWVSDELRAAGARAHNRFLLDFCSEAPGRLLGVPLIYPWPDWTAAVADMTRGREAGFRAIYPPITAGVPGDIPALYDPWWDPMWAACADLGLAVHIHANFGVAQGSVISLVRDAFNRVADVSDGDAVGQAYLDSLDTADPSASVGQGDLLRSLFETFTERRPLWQLMWGGVFDRFPKLKIVFQEIHGDWVPPTLAYLDRMHAADAGPLKLKPSEYWQRHCAVGASLMRYGDVAARHEIGLDKLMFGTDCPHIEGTWPNTHDWIRATMGSIPMADARRILGDNAIDFYGLDRELLEKTAKRIGPLPGEILGSGHTVDPRILEHFAYRGGIDKQVNYDEETLAMAFQEDRAGALAARKLKSGSAF